MATTMSDVDVPRAKIGTINTTRTNDAIHVLRRIRRKSTSTATQNNDDTSAFRNAPNRLLPNAHGDRSASRADRRKRGGVS
jgi:hypothetical protein